MQVPGTSTSTSTHHLYQNVSNVEANVPEATKIQNIETEFGNDYWSHILLALVGQKILRKAMPSPTFSFYQVAVL